MKTHRTKTWVLLILSAMTLSACMETVSPTPAKTLDPTNGVEIIVYTYDWPMYANVPELHIAKNGHGLWVTYDEDDLTHVYETYLSQDEMIQVQEVLESSGFWEKAQPKAKFTPSSASCIWASDANQEGVVPPSALINVALTTSLQRILEASRNKQEYFPKSAYLFVSEKRRLYFNDDAYSWPDDKLQFEFDASNEGVYIDGETLSTIWEAVQQNEFRIASKDTAYKYELMIPGVSCVRSFEPYMCNIYSAETR